MPYGKSEAQLEKSMSTTVPRRSIADVFAATRRSKSIALMPFIPAGYPDLATTKAVIPALEKAGASLLEIGFPFSDPIADGPTIQQAFVEALAKKLKVVDIFAAITEIRGAVSIPLVAMVSYSIVYRHGLDRFLREAKESGFDGVLMPDLPPPEADAICARVRAAGLETILLVAPTTSTERRREIADLCSGFVYYLSLSGTTGERKSLPEDLAANVAELKSLTDKPICVGFGISTAAHVEQLAGHADGAIVGSALVRRMKEHAGQSPEQIAAAAGEYCRSLMVVNEPDHARR